MLQATEGPALAELSSLSFKCCSDQCARAVSLKLECYTDHGSDPASQPLDKAHISSTFDAGVEALARLHEGLLQNALIEKFQDAARSADQS